MSPITVLGASGFIGSALVKRLKETGVEHFAPGRNERLLNRPLGNIIYCIGLTAVSGTRVLETVQAHVGELLDVLRDYDFDSLLYLSSTRLYRSTAAPAREEDDVLVNSLNRDDLFNISKVMGESLALACGRKTRVVRLSNVYGLDFASGNFLPSIIKDAILTKKVVLHTAPDSEKDYVGIDDAVDALIKIATSGCHNIYNVASGVNVSHQQLLDRIRELTGCEVTFDREAPKASFPQISVERIRREFDWQPASALEDMNTLIDSYRRHYGTQPASHQSPKYQSQGLKKSPGLKKPKAPNTKKVLVTGASGFIGQHCLPFLQNKGYEVHAVSSKATKVEDSANLTWHQADLLVADQVTGLLAQVKPTHLLHLAWYGLPKKYWTSPENFRWVAASLNLLESFTRCGGERVVVAGTCAEYDWNSGYCSEEKTPLNPTTTYGLCKHALHLMLDALGESSGLSTAWGRFFFLYGPHEHAERLVASVVRSCLQGPPARCLHGGQARDFLYVEDAAAAVVALLDSKITGAVNIASGVAVPSRQMIEEIVAQLDKRGLIEMIARPMAEDESPLLVADIARLRNEVGWTPQYSLERGLAETINWWKLQPEK